MKTDNMTNNTNKEYRYRPWLFFFMAYLFTWIFWIPAAFVPENAGAALMLIGLLAPAVVSTVFTLVSGSDVLKKDLKNKIVGFYKVKWANVFQCISRCTCICRDNRSYDLTVTAVRTVSFTVLLYG